MERVPLLVKRIEGKHIVWFRSCNHWIEFDESAWFVYRLFAKGSSPEEIISHCRKKYGSGLDECRVFLLEIPLKSPAPAVSHFLNEQDASKRWYSTQHYSINYKVLTISFQSGWLEYCVYPLPAHFETVRPSNEGICFLLFQQDNRFGIRVSSDLFKTWIFDQPELQKGRMFIEMLNTIYNRQEDDWMTIVHGSAIDEYQYFYPIILN